MGGGRDASPNGRPHAALDGSYGLETQLVAPRKKLPFFLQKQNAMVTRKVPEEGCGRFQARFGEGPGWFQ